MEDTASSSVEEGTQRASSSDEEGTQRASSSVEEGTQRASSSDEEGTQRASSSVEEVTQRASSSDKERIQIFQLSDEKLLKLHESFEAVPWNHNVSECNHILQAIGSIIVKRKFEKFIDGFSSGNDLQKLHGEDRAKLYDEIEKISVFVEYYLDCTRSESEVDILWKELKSTMLMFLDQIDHTLLPEKYTFIERLKNVKEYEPIYELKPLRRSHVNYVNYSIPRCLCDVQDANTASVLTDLLNPDYGHWIKGTLTLKRVNEGARCLTRLVFQNVLSRLPDNGSHFDDGEMIKRMCEEVIQWDHGKWKFIQNNIHCIQCKTVFNIVIDNHLNMKHKNAGLHNCKDTPVGGAWGIAKLFMPKGCRNVTTPEDSDTKALFQLILNCGLFYKPSVANTEKIIEMRNDMMHSPDFTMTVDQFKEVYDSSLRFLKEAINQCDDGKVRQKLVASKEDVEKIGPSVIEVGNILEYGKTAMEYESEDLEKQQNRVDNEDCNQLWARQQRLKIKLNSYTHVEDSSLFMQYKTLVLQNNDEIKNLRGKLLDSERTRKLLMHKLNDRDSTIEKLRKKLHDEEESCTSLRNQFTYACRELSEKLCWICRLKNFVFLR